MVSVELSDNHGGVLHVDATNSGVAVDGTKTNNSADVLITGTLAQINAALSGLTYQRTLSSAGSETITVAMHDSNPTSYLVPKTGSNTIVVTVDPNDTPVVSKSLISATSPTFTDKSAHAITGLSVADDYNTSVLSATLTDTNGGLLKLDTVNTGVTVTAGTNNSNSVTVSGTLAQINAALATLNYTATYNLAVDSSDTVTVSVADGYTHGIGGIKTGSTSVTVNLTGNDTPVVSVPAVVVSQTYSYSFSDTVQHAVAGVTVADTYNDGAVTATVSAAKGLLNVTAQDADINTTFATLTTNDTNTVIITGSLADVSATLSTLKYTTTATATGTDTITITVNDGGANRIGDAKSATNSFTIALTENAAPTITTPSVTPTVSNNSLNTVGDVNTANTLIRIADSSIGGTVTVTVSDLHGNLALTATGGGVVDSGNNSSSVTIHGASIAAVNATLATLQYQTLATNTGTETIKVTVNDGDTSAIGGAKTADNSFQIALTGNAAPVVTAPETSVVVGDNHARTVSGFAFTDTSVGATVSATITALAGNLHLGTVTGVTIDSGNDSTSLAIHASTKAALNDALASFTYSAFADLVPDTITVTVNDGNTTGVGGAKSGSASLAVVTAPNDLPVFNSPADQTYYYTANNAIPTFSFTDTYYGDNVTATVTVNSGTVHLTGNGGTITANDSALVTVTGSVAQVNSALNAMKRKLPTTMRHEKASI